MAPQPGFQLQNCKRITTRLLGFARVHVLSFNSGPKPTLNLDKIMAMLMYQSRVNDHTTFFDFVLGHI